MIDEKNVNFWCQTLQNIMLLIFLDTYFYYFEKFFFLSAEWLKIHNMSTDFEQFSEPELDQMMSQFYRTAQKRGGDPFSATALLAFRTAITRYLNKCDRSICIASSQCFKNSNSVLSQIQSSFVKVSKNIPIDDLQLLYSSGVLSNRNPRSLLYKVWFELQIYFRSKIDWSKVCVEQFIFHQKSPNQIMVSWYPEGYGKSIHEIEATGGPFCPVQSIRLYLEKRNKSNKSFLQVPMVQWDRSSTLWYMPEELPKHKEKQFMKQISAFGKLNHVYTNACVIASFGEYQQALFNLETVKNVKNQTFA